MGSRALSWAVHSEAGFTPGDLYGNGCEQQLGPCGASSVSQWREVIQGLAVPCTHWSESGWFIQSDFLETSWTLNETFWLTFCEDLIYVKIVTSLIVECLVFVFMDAFSFCPNWGRVGLWRVPWTRIQGCVSIYRLPSRTPALTPWKHRQALLTSMDRGHGGKEYWVSHLSLCPLTSYGSDCCHNFPTGCLGITNYVAVRMCAL